MTSSDDPDRKGDRMQDPMRTAPLVSGPQRADHLARSWQIIATMVGAIAIVMLVLYGLNNQRDENKEAGEQTAATQITPSTAPGGGNAAQPAQGGQQSNQNRQDNQQRAATPQNNAPSTTGQAPNNAGTTSNKNNQNAAAGNPAQNPAPNAQPAPSGQPARDSPRPANSGTQ